MLPDLISSIQILLQGELPGVEAQNRMTPAGRHPTSNYKPIPNPKQGAVLILIRPTKDGFSFPVTQRPVHLNQHGGQISLPGGKVDLMDENLFATALRETKEEIGIGGSSVKLLGALTPLYIPVSQFMVHPFVGFTDVVEKYSINSEEVGQVSEIELSDLVDENNVGNGMFYLELLKKEFEMPCFNLNGLQIWGATAMILSELKVLMMRL